jgi:predicted NBD/HSP70 family sugar kinase
MCLFGWDIGATKWVGIGEVCDGDGGTRRIMGHGLTTDTPASVLTSIQRWTQASLASAYLGGEDHAVERYCAFAGSVDESGVVVGWPNRPSWVGYPLHQCLFPSADEGGRIDDDGLCAAMGEHRFGVAAVYRDFLCVTLGTGIGSGLFIDGSVRRTATPALALGHLSVGGGEVCSCGRVGCLQSVFSGRKYLSQERGGAFIEPDASSDSVDILIRVASGFAGFLGLEAIIVTGGLVGYWPRFADGLVSRLGEALAGVPCVAVASSFPHLSAAYGALELSYTGEQL